jgi:hypothetical protein
MTAGTTSATIATSLVMRVRRSVVMKSARRDGDRPDWRLRDVYPASRQYARIRGNSMHLDKNRRRHFREIVARNLYLTECR